LPTALKNEMLMKMFYSNTHKYLCLYNWLISPELRDVLRKFGKVEHVYDQHDACRNEIPEIIGYF
jgi:hypothetical protein